jgi:hypothetical protein
MRGVPDLTVSTASIEKRSDLPPAEGVTMGDITLDDQTTLLLQIPDDLAVGLFDVDALVFRDLGSESTSLVNGTRWDLIPGDDTVGETDSVIVVSPCRSLVDDTGTSILGDVGIREDSERSVLIL